MRLDYSKLTEAEATIAAGNRVLEVNCMCCQGHSLPGALKGQPGHCPQCAGTCYVKECAWVRGGPEKAIDYWQARALVAELKVAKLHGVPGRVCPKCGSTFITDASQSLDCCTCGHSW